MIKKGLVIADLNFNALFANRTALFADGTSLFTGFTDGTALFADGTALFADGTVRFADRTAPFLNGTSSNFKSAIMRSVTKKKKIYVKIMILEKKLYYFACL